MASIPLWNQGTPSKEPRWPKIAKWKEETVLNERKRNRGRWVKDAMDIDEDGSGDDISKESEDDEKTSRRLRPVTIWVSPSYAKVSHTLRKLVDPDTNILLSSLPMVSSISPQWASEVTFISDNYT